MPPSRTWNYWLGGKDFYPADEQAGAAVEALFAPIGDTARGVEYFAVRAVRFLAEEGVRQFLDIGCGMPPPSGDPVHEIARRAAPGCRVVYADSG